MIAKNIFILLAALLVSACSSEEAAMTTAGNDAPAVASSDKILSQHVLAKVNGQAITQENVELIVDSGFANASLIKSNPQVMDKVLQSAISSKAMGILMTQELTPGELKAIEEKAKAYKEELLVKEYLQKYASPEPVTQRMVEGYYQANQQQYGGENIKLVEMITFTSQAEADKRDEFLSAIATLKTHESWSSYVKSSPNKQFLKYQKVKVRAGLLDPALEAVTNKLNAGETSGTVMATGKPTIVRVIQVETLPVKPLAEVASSIRQKLAALQLKKSVKAVSDNALKKVKVEIFSTDTNTSQRATQQ